MRYVLDARGKLHREEGSRCPQDIADGLVRGVEAEVIGHSGGLTRGLGHFGAVEVED